MTRGKTLFILAGICVLFLFLTVNPLLFQSYWENEADYVLNAKLPVQAIATFLPRDQSLPYYFLLHYWMMLFGTSEPATRSFSILCALGALFFIYRISRLLSGDRWVAILAVLFFSLSHSIILLSQETKHWMLFTFLTLGSLFFLIRGFLKQKTRDGFIFLALGLLNLFSCLYAYFIFPVQLFFLAGWWIRDKKSPLGRLLLSSLIVGSSALLLELSHLFAGLNYVHSRGPQWGLPSHWPDFYRELFKQLFFNWSEVTGSSFRYLFYFGSLVALFCFGFGLWQIKSPLRWLFLSLFFLPLGASQQVAVTGSIRSRYFIHLVPLFLLLASIGLRSLRWKTLRWLFLASLIVSNFVSLFMTFRFSRKEDWKSAVPYLTSQLKEEDLVLIMPHWVKSGFQFYSSARFLAADEISLNYLTHSNRVWVISLYAERQIDSGPFVLFDKKNFFNVWLRGYALPSAKQEGDKTEEETYHFRAAHRWAKVSVRPFVGEVRELPYFSKEAYHYPAKVIGEKGEGLLFDIWQSQPYSVFPLRWLVAAKTIQKSNGVLKDAIWAHPPENGRLSLRYEAVPLGKTLEGFYGFTDNAVKYGRSYVRFSVEIDGQSVHEAVKGNRAGWVEFSINTASKEKQKATVVFNVEAADARVRHFCFDAVVRA